MIRVLIVDDSAVSRKALSRALARARDIDVAATAVDAYAARSKILKLRPDVVTLDLDMPRMDGLTFLARLMKYRPLPVVVVSAMTPVGSEAALRAMELGAIEVVDKADLNCSGDGASRLLASKIRVAAVSHVARRPAVRAVRKSRSKPPRRHTGLTARPTRKLLAIGASTGGVTAIEEILANLPPDMPATVVAEHMPGQFSATFARRLNDFCRVQVREARNNDTVAGGLVLIAPGGHDMTLKRSGEKYVVRITDQSPASHPHPNINMLFHSVAQHAGANGVGVILTGMGTDGADGLLAMHHAGAITFAQDEGSSIVFGMPKEAIRLGAADKVVPLRHMAGKIVEACTANNVQGRGASPGRAKRRRKPPPTAAPRRRGTGPVAAEGR